MDTATTTQSLIACGRGGGGSFGPVSKFDIRAVLEYYEAEDLPMKGGWAPIRCVIHEETRPSASFHEDWGRFTCFACDFRGDALDLIMRKEGVDLASAITRAEEITGSEGRELSSSTAGAGRRKPARLSDRGARPDAGNNQAVRPGGRRKPRRIG